MAHAPGATAVAPLQGVRVVDLSRVLAGPSCTQILGDLGADVVKVERPGGGDDTRQWGPPFLDGAHGREATYYLGANRNKRSVTVDLGQADGQAVVHRLLEGADVLVENFKVGGLRPYGLDADTLLAAHPRLVYCSITGYGQSGPYAARAGYDLLIQAASGLMSFTGAADEAGGGPTKAGVAVVDVMTGVYAATAVLAALRARDLTGRGQHIDMALLDVGMAMLVNQGSGFLNAGAVPGRQGNAHPSIVPYQDFRTRDGALVLAVGNDGQFAALCRGLGHEAWAALPRFASNAARVRHREELVALLQAAFEQRTTAHWVETLQQAGIPCGPLYDTRQAFEDPHVQARGLRVAQRREDGTVIDSVASPIRLSGTPVRLQRPPPRLGEHTQEVLAELGYTPGERADLAARGAI